MRFERLDEPLAWVEARFEKGAISPLRFKWKHREFVVSSTNARWVDRDTRPVRWSFSVSVSSGEVYELCHREGEPVWYVMAIMTE
jgi:hypothetical protein